MTSEITVRCTDELIRLAARRYLVRDLCHESVPALIVLVLTIVFWIVFNPNWKMPFLLILLSLGRVLCFLLIRFRYTQQFVTKFRELKNPTSMWEFSPQVIAVNDENESSEYRWNAVAAIWRYPDFWMLHVWRVGYYVLPLESIPEDLQAFIVAQVERNGGKVD